MVYLSSHDFKLVLEGSIDGFGDKVHLNLAPLRVLSDADRNSFAAIAVGFRDDT
jgi:hypothetical protein